MASTEPHRERCGKVAQRVRMQMRQYRLQRSRTANGAEKAIRSTLQVRASNSFNGAAPRTVRKTYPERPLGNAAHHASTEPHRERCGKLAKLMNLTLFPNGFNGAAPRTVRKSAALARPRCHWWSLQRSRTANGAENRAVRGGRQPSHLASTEPHRERCGKK